MKLKITPNGPSYQPEYKLQKRTATEQNEEKDTFMIRIPYWQEP